MKRLLVIICFLLLTAVESDAQEWITQKSKEGFCGLALDSADLPFYAKEVAFLRLKEGDTLIDLGSSSGWFEGTIACISSIQKQHFVLVDIDQDCLNQQTLKHMLAYYSALKGSTINHTYQIAINKKRDLGLSHEMGSKFLLRNTLHEVNQPAHFIKQLYQACRTNGQVIVIEQQPSKKGQKHEGCNDKMLDASIITQLFEKNGFALMEKQIQVFEEGPIQYLRYTKF